MAVQVSSVEASSRLRDLIDAALRGEEVFIVDQGQKTVQLVPVRSVKPSRQFGSAQGLVEMSDDFDEPYQPGENEPERAVRKLDSKAARSECD